ncbi:hypothetical protein QA612_11970 [Evansella sp. AB-P1]|uniref:hypothetical protein n=1 Tax=Evansella sp. AB-P1 TaxID=3037653 RepID=UPI00241F8BFB|nr:hypothetical protein [Evansella sp. AB-P1]MDG5788206.1 hypothetical protein [Evansella sp. AB-P1]
MTKRSRIVPKEAEQLMDHYREEIAQEFGIFQSSIQTDQQANMHSVTRKIVNKNQKGKK